MAADVDDLRLVAPQDFVAARNAVVKALRAEGRRDDAAAVAKLRRPSPVDWALNTVAVRNPQVVDAVVDAHAHLREVQERAVRERAATPDLRGASAVTRSAAGALRVAADEVLKAGGRPSSDASALATRVNEISVDPTLLAQLQAGRLGTAPVEPVDPFAELARWAVQAPIDQEVPAGTGAAPPVTAPVKRADRSAQRRTQAVQRRATRPSSAWRSPRGSWRPPGVSSRRRRHGSRRHNEMNSPPGSDPSAPSIDGTERQPQGL